MNLKEIFENKLKIETKVVSIESVFSEVKVMLLGFVLREAQFGVRLS